MVPMVNTAAQAQQVVDASRFPPAGVRGQGSPFSSMAFGITTADYVKQANDLVQVIIQIESREGLANIVEICQVDGVCESLGTSTLRSHSRD
jgi:4-hydroxy-2-oxoheptanedioate aldolase